MTENKKEHPLKSIVRLGWRPSLLALFTAVEGFVETLFIAHIGLSAIEAVTIAGNVLLIQLAIYATIGSVTNYCTSTAKNKAEAWKYLLQGLYLSFFVCLVLGTLTLVLAKQLLALYGVEATSSGILYLQVVGGTCLFPALFGVARDGLQGLGLQKSAMYAGWTMILFRLLLDYILIYPLHLGLMGAACASVLSSLIKVVWIIVAFLRHAGTGLQWQIDWTIQKEIFGQALPKALGSLSNQGSMVIYFAILARTGTEALAANRIFNVVQGVFFFTWMRGVFASITPVVGPIIEKNKQVVHYIRWTLGTVLMCSIVSWVIQLMFAKAVVGIFTDDPDVTKMAVWLLLLYVWVNGLWAVYVCVGEVLGAFKETQVTSIIMFLSSVILVIGCWVASPTLVAISYAEAVQYLFMGTVSVAFLCGYYRHAGVSLFPISAAVTRAVNHLKTNTDTDEMVQIYFRDFTWSRNDELNRYNKYLRMMSGSKNLSPDSFEEMTPVFRALRAYKAFKYLESASRGPVDKTPVEDVMLAAEHLLVDALAEIEKKKSLQNFFEFLTEIHWDQERDSIAKEIFTSFRHYAKDRAQSPEKTAGVRMQLNLVQYLGLPELNLDMAFEACSEID